MSVQQFGNPNQELMGRDRILSHENSGREELKGQPKVPELLSPRRPENVEPKSIVRLHPFATSVQAGD